MVLLGVLLCSPAHARAEALPLELSFRAPSECPSANAVHEELLRITRVRPGVTLSPMTAQVEIARVATGYSLTVRTEHAGQKGERVLSAGDCETLVRSLTLVLALTFGPGVEVGQGAAAGEGAAPDLAVPSSANEAASGKVEAEPSSAAASEPPTASKQVEPEADDDAGADDEANADDEGSADADASEVGEEDSSNAAPHELRVGVLLGAGVALGLLPETALALSAGAELRSQAWSLGVRVAGMPGATAEVTSQIDARFDGVLAALDGCAHKQLSGFDFGLCVGPRGGALRGRGQGSERDQSKTAPWLALGAGLYTRYPLGASFALRAGGEILGSFMRPRFVIENFGLLHHVPVVAAEASVGLVLTP